MGPNDKQKIKIVPYIRDLEGKNDKGCRSTKWNPVPSEGDKNGINFIIIGRRRMFFQSGIHRQSACS